MCGCTSEDEGREERQRDDEGVEEAIVSFSHTVADPGAVMIEALHTVVTQAAVGGARRTEDLAGEAVLEFNHLLVDDDLLGARRGTVRRGRARRVVDLLLDVCRLLWCGPGQNPRIREAGLEERDHHKHKQDPSDGRDAAGEVLHQVRAVEYEEESAGEQDERQCERQHAALTRRDDASVAAEAVFPGKHLPFPPESSGRVIGRRRRERLRIYLLIFSVFHPSRRSASVKHQLLRGEMSRDGVMLY